jgi:hypothetical protein
MMQDSMDPLILYRKLESEIAQLPDHTPDEVESAAHHLEMLHYQNMLEAVDRNFLRYRKTDVLKKLQEIARLDAEHLRATRTVVEEWDRPEVTVEENRRRRMELIAREYKKLCRLRSNDPKAWDDINELYYDD